MTDTSITKVQADAAPTGAMGQRYLAGGTRLSMRLWSRRPPGQDDPPVRRDYETVGYVIDGSALLHLEGQTVRLEPGDSWVVPPGAEHAYEIRSDFTAVEATSPPAPAHARDEPAAG